MAIDSMFSNIRLYFKEEGKVDKPVGLGDSSVNIPSSFGSDFSSMAYNVNEATPEIPTFQIPETKAPG